MDTTRLIASCHIYHAGRLIGYARVITQHQIWRAQFESFTEAGVESRLNFQNSALGAKASCLDACLEVLRDCDGLVGGEVDDLRKPIEYGRL